MAGIDAIQRGAVWHQMRVTLQGSPNLCRSPGPAGKKMNRGDAYKERMRTRLKPRDNIMELTENAEHHEIIK